MVHNSTGYGMMQAYAEGFDRIQRMPEGERFALNVPDIAEVWRRGSVISFWLLDLRAPGWRGNRAYTTYVRKRTDGSLLRGYRF